MPVILGNAPQSNPKAPQSKLESLELPPRELSNGETKTNKNDVNMSIPNNEQETLRIGTWNCSCPKPQLDADLNPIGDTHDYRPDNYFKNWVNNKIYILDFVGSILKTGDNFEKALKDTVTFEGGIQAKGLDIECFRSGSGEWPNINKFKQHLTKSGQLWVFSNQRKTVVPEEHLKAIKLFYDEGHGVALWGDNDNLYNEANAVLEYLHPGHFLDGCIQADEKVSRISGSLENAYEKIKKKNPGFAPHDIMTGVNNLYAGVTISAVSYTKGGARSKIGKAGNQIGSDYTGPFKPLLCSHDGCITSAFYEGDGKRLVVDGGFTRVYSSKWDTAGTARFVKNLACWLANEQQWVKRNPDTKEAQERRININPTLNTSNQIDAIVKTVRHMHADVVCLQNCDENIFKMITSHTTLRSITPSQDTVRILYNPSHVELVPDTVRHYCDREKSGKCYGTAISAQFILLTEALVIRRKLEMKVKEIWKQWQAGLTSLEQSRIDLDKKLSDVEKYSDEYNKLVKQISTVSDEIEGYKKNKPKKPSLRQSSRRFEKGITVVSALMFDDDNTTRAKENAKKLMSWGNNTKSICESHSFALGVSSKFAHSVLTRTQSNKDLELRDCHHLLEDPYEVTFPILPCTEEASQEPPMMQDCIAVRADAIIPSSKDELQLQMVSSMKMVKYRHRKFEDGTSLFDKLNPSPHAPLVADFGFSNTSGGDGNRILPDDLMNFSIMETRGFAKAIENGDDGDNETKTTSSNKEKFIGASKAIENGDDGDNETKTTSSSKEKFIGASRFGGAKEGYVFKTGHRGLGYYLN
jgi:hypothetical protein